MSSDAQDLYLALGALPAQLGVDADVAAAVCALSAERAHTILDELADAGITEPVRGHGGLARHRLTDAAHARARDAQPQGADKHRTGAGLRLCEWLLVLAAGAWDRTRCERGLLVPAAAPAEWRLPFPAGEGQPWFEERHDLVETVLDLAEKADWHGIVWQLADALYVYAEAERPPWWRNIAVRGRIAACRAGHAAAERRMIWSLAVALAADGDDSDIGANGQLTELARLARVDGDRADEARATYGLGLILSRRGHHTAARDRLLKAADLWGPAARGTVPALTAAAEAALCAGDPAGAAGAAGRAYAAATVLRRDHDAAWALALRGRARHRLSDVDTAVEDLLTALPAHPHDNGERAHVATLTWLAEALMAAGDPARAEFYALAARALPPAPAPAPAGVADALGPLL
ncbi:hypothetical protein [Streptomyces albipurpureus]|uniref:Tetratricopeptide repeat protein n=1 Tax=Streptomyces albipurpureus TaxID=2897419 RepID=A0ABT0UVW8_9ACTN|nr:hypothetical protein [Streptomyces sp. CWNU-1]MCM2392722.1 hypothetical protein [Streptomyces sp. CWNU-1]